MSITFFSGCEKETAKCWSDFSRVPRGPVTVTCLVLMSTLTALVVSPKRSFLCPSSLSQSQDAEGFLRERKRTTVGDGEGLLRVNVLHFGEITGLTGVEGKVVVAGRRFTFTDWRAWQKMKFGCANSWPWRELGPCSLSRHRHGRQTEPFDSTRQTLIKTVASILAIRVRRMRFFCYIETFSRAVIIVRDRGASDALALLTP